MGEPARRPEPNLRPPEWNLRRTAGYLRRALRLRCPECGAAPMFETWLRQRERCAACGLRFDRGEHDSFIGAYMLNFIIAELAVVAGMLFGIAVTWPDVPWNTLVWAMAPFLIALPILTYPFSKALWLALYLIYQPPTARDFEKP